jgi:hypothetical protein
MSKAQLTGALAALALCLAAPRLAAQDTSSTGAARADTSGYTGVGGVDTTGQPGRVAPSDTAGGAADTLNGGVTDSTASDTGMSGRHPHPTAPGSNTNPSGAAADSATGAPPSSATGPTGSTGTSSDSSSVSQPGKEPGTGTSRTGSTDSTSP